MMENVGYYDSIEAFVEEFVYQIAGDLPEIVKNHVDIWGIWVELSTSGAYEAKECGCGVEIFRNHIVKEWW